MVGMAYTAPGRQMDVAAVTARPVPLSVLLHCCRHILGARERLTPQKLSLNARTYYSPYLGLRSHQLERGER